MHVFAVLLLSLSLLLCCGRWLGLGVGSVHMYARVVERRELREEKSRFRGQML